MRIAKGRGDYLDYQIKNNRNLALILLIIGAITLVIYGLGIIFIIASIYLFRRKANYTKGKVGEITVEKYLHGLGDEYSLINDVVIPGNIGNIDHVVLGPNGIFAIESKNYDGDIICDGDKWYRYYEGGLTFGRRRSLYWKSSREYDIGSPSKQVKGNCYRLKQYIQKSLGKNIWVEGIVVFTNPDVKLEIKNPTITILKVDQLNGFIKNKKSYTIFSTGELKSIKESILGQS